MKILSINQIKKRARKKVIDSMVKKQRQKEKYKEMKIIKMMKKERNKLLQDVRGFR